jgi:ATP-dependent Clp protease ATP-binding subunit ClpA
MFNVLRAVFDKGRLTDRYRRLTTFRSAIIVPLFPMRFRR